MLSGDCTIFIISMVAAGCLAKGEIKRSGDRDWLAVELVAGRTYRVDLLGNRTEDGILHDPCLRDIDDADGNLPSNTTNGDGGASCNSRANLTAR